MSNRGSYWGEFDPSWDVAIRERSVNRSLERERSVRPLTRAERRAVDQATSALLEGRSKPSAYRTLRRFDGGDSAFDSRHLDLLREVFQRVNEARVEREPVGV